MQQWVTNYNPITIDLNKNYFLNISVGSDSLNAIRAYSILQGNFSLVAETGDAPEFVSASLSNNTINTYARRRGVYVILVHFE